MAGKDGDEDDALWADMMADVTPLPGHNAHTPAQASLPAAKLPPQPVNKVRQAADRPAMPATVPVVSTAIIGSGLDANTRQRLERGQMDIEATLDLHGHKQEEGRQAMTAFLLAAYHSGKRCVLVITGIGRLTKNEKKPWWDSRRGVLKASFTDWVQEPPLDRVVLHTALARGKDGGSGAYYVLLRRDRANGPI